jgi:acetylglutamate kinase
MASIEHKEGTMVESVKKAKILTEALPYIQRFSGKIVVVKYGGSAMTNPDLQAQVIRDLALMKQVGMLPVVVHGGGKAISNWMEKVGMEPKFHNGLRITDGPAMELTEMVLAGKVNKELVHLFVQAGTKSVGLSGKDAGLLLAEKKQVEGADLGFVGTVKTVNIEYVELLLEQGYLPVIAPIGFDLNGNSLNLNADEAASAIACALNAEKLVFLTDVDGVMKNPEDSSTLCSSLNRKDALAGMEAGWISGGMIPKIEMCLQALDQGVRQVHMLNGTWDHALLLEIFTDQGIGTMIKEDEK